MSGAPTSNGASERRAYPIDVFEDDAEAVALREEEHLLACEEAIALVAESYERDWDERVRRIKAEAWHLALAQFSAQQIKALVLAELQVRTNPYPPIPGDIIARHTGEAWSRDDDGKTERVVIANPQAYEPLKPTRNELIARGLLSPDAPTPPGVARSGPEGLALPPAPPPGFNDAEGKARRAARDLETLDDKVNRALWENCEMKTFSFKRELRLEFGHWFLKRFPLDEWTPKLGKAQWKLWQKEIAPDGPHLLWASWRIDNRIDDVEVEAGEVPQTTEQATGA